MKKKQKNNLQKPLNENELILREARKIVIALGKMFAPCCEVVLHDLTRPDHAICEIVCSLSGRKIGDSTTEMGFARIENSLFPEIVQNYANQFPDGRPAKSTSIGLKNSKGEFVASICLNLDISLFSSVHRVLEQLTSSDENSAPVTETLRTRSTEELRQMIETFSAKRNTQPRALTQKQRRELIQSLAQQGLLLLRNAPSITAEILGISRASVYNNLKAGIKFYENFHLSRRRIYG